MEYSLSNSLVGGGGGLNPDKLSLDLPFAITKSLTAAKGPTPTFVRASTGTYFGSDGYLKSAANNVARFDHETSYAGSTVFVQCIDCVDVYSNVFSAAERIPLSGIDGNGYPYFLSSLFSVSYSISTSEWILSYDAGNFEAYSVTGLSDEYIPYGAIGGTANVITELACKGLLIEESSANLTPQSNNFNNVTYWTIGAATLTPTAAPSPEGSVNAYELKDTTSTAAHFVSSLATTPVISGNYYTFSFYAKKSAKRYCSNNYGSALFGVQDYAVYDLQAGIITQKGTTNVATIENVGNGWWRCSNTVQAIASGNSFCGLISLAKDPTFAGRQQSYLGDGTGIYIYGAQLEAKAFPTSYIPTTTGSAPRSADLCSITSSAFAGFYNQTEGSFAASVIFNTPITNASGQIVFDVSDGTLSNRFRLARNATTGFFAMANTSGGTQDVAINGSTAMNANAVMKLSACMKANDFAAYLNGVSQGVDTTAAMPLSLTTLTIGDIFAAAAAKPPLNGCISSIKYYKKRLTNAKLQSLTT